MSNTSPDEVDVVPNRNAPHLTYSTMIAAAKKKWYCRPYYLVLFVVLAAACIIGVGVIAVIVAVVVLGGRGGGSAGDMTKHHQQDHCHPLLPAPNYEDTPHPALHRYQPLYRRKRKRLLAIFLSLADKRE